jgi:SAM-dependent methyltransferase
MIDEVLTSFARSHPSLKMRLREWLSRFGYDTAYRMRIVTYRRCFEFVRSLGPEQLDVLEVSAGLQSAREYRFRSYTPTQYPGFDLCTQTLPARFDLIVADQLFEHLRWPYRAGRNVRAILTPGGVFLITDCTRWTAEGLYYFLQECGFHPAGITVDQWGNRACVKANFVTWRKRGPFGSLENEPDFPIVVWAFARNVAEGDVSSPNNR